MKSNLNISKKTNNVKEYYIELIKILLEHIDSNKEIYSAMMKINSNSIAKDMMTEAIITYITKEIDNNYTNESKIPTKTIVLFYASGIINIIIENLKNSNDFNKQKLLIIINDLLPKLESFKNKK